ncbi:MAG: hypothetical protein IJY98_03570 [Bacteroidaceae bacterium]|nr:hypothetical protein [Bacteroidaceae bacterium]
MKRKKYQSPNVRIVEVNTSGIIAASTGVLSNRRENDYNNNGTENRNGWEGLWSNQ